MNDSSKTLLATSLGHFINDGLNNIFPIVYPLLLLAPYAYTNISIGILSAVLSVFSIVTSPLIGRRSDVGRNFVSMMSGGIIIMAIGVAGFALSMYETQGNELFLLLIGSSALAGLGSSFYHPIGAAILNQTWSKKNRALAMGVNGSMGSVGILILPIMANLAIVRSGIVSLVALGALGGAIALLIYFLMKASKFSNKTVEQFVTSKERGAADTFEARATVPLKIVFITMLGLTLFSFFRSILFQGFNQFLPVYLYKVNHVPYAFVALAVSVVPGVGIVSQPLFGRLADRFDLRNIVALSSVGGIASIAIFIFSPNFTVAEIFLGISGAFQYTAFPLLLALSSQIAPKGATTLSNSIVWGVGTVGGGALGPVLVGLLSGTSMLGSLTSTFVVLLLIGAVGLVFVPFIPKPLQITDSSAI